MKNILSIMFLFALLASSCSEDELVKNQSANSLKFTASFEEDESRTYVEEGNLLRWTAGDQISLFVANTLNQQYQFEGKTGANSGYFNKIGNSFGTGNDLNRHYAVYPYASDIEITENGVITATLPSKQSYAENSFGLGANTMVAVTKNTDDTYLKFKNVGGYLKLQLYGDDVTVKSITLQGNSNEKIAGTATITATYGGEPTVSMANDATESITLDCREGVTIGSTVETATAFWMVVPPTTFEEGFTITVTDVNDKEFTKSTSKNIEIERNVIQSMNAFEVKMVTPMGDITDPSKVVKGDYAMIDGTFISKNATLNNEQKKNVAGIVFWIEDDESNATLSTDVVMNKDFPNCTHGLIVALKDISSSRIVWQGTEELYESVSDVFQVQNDEYNPEKSDYLAIKSGIGTTRISGYNNTKVIKAYNNYCVNNKKTDYVVKPVEFLNEFEENNPAPINSTGWYIPSVREIHMLCYKDVNQVWGLYGVETRDLVNSLLDKLSAEKIKTEFYYFSSSECNDNPATGAFSIIFSNGQLLYSRKHYNSYVRAICAF